MAEKIAGAFFLALILLGMALYYFGVPHDALGWLALMVLGIPLMLGFEWLGGVVHVLPPYKIY